MAQAQWIEIDGSTGEGGGQMLRTSLALSAITGKPLQLRNIRARREKPGLQAQHLTCVLAAAEIARADIHGASLGSQNITFQPQAVQSGHFEFRIGTAGATSLVLQTVYLPLLLKTTTTCTVRILGGTHARMAPSAEFLQLTFAEYLRRLGFSLDISLDAPGFYPRGGGVLSAELQPAGRLRPLQLAQTLNPQPTDWEMLCILGGNLPGHIAERMIQQVQFRLGSTGMSQTISYPRTLSPGVVATLIDRRGPIPSAFFAHGVRGKPAERVADEVVDEYLSHCQTGAPVDPHSADQLLLPLALIEGTSQFHTSSITQHLLTNIDVIGRFVERDFRYDGQLGAPGWITIA